MAQTKKNKWNIHIILKGGAGSFGGQYETDKRSSKEVAQELFCGPENSLQAIVDVNTRQHRFFKLGEVAAFFISID